MIYKKIKTSRLLNNMSWLFVLNLINSIVPYLIIPYIVRLFGAEGFGMLEYALIIVTYFQAFIDYGFNLSGAKKISTFEGDNIKISKVFSNILVIKFLFFLISIIVIFLLSNFIPSMSEIKNILYIYIIMLLGNVITPVWLFQGLQIVKYLSVISLLVRVLFLISIFVMVQSLDDLYKYAFLYSFSFLLIGILSLVYVLFKLDIKFVLPSLNKLIAFIKEGYYLFLSSAIVLIMNSMGVLLLGFFHSPSQVAYYAAANKINLLLLRFFYPVGQALFPYFGKKFEESFEDAYKDLRKKAKIILFSFSLIVICIIVLRNHITTFLFGEEFAVVGRIIPFLILVPLISIVSNFLGTQILVASGNFKAYSIAFKKTALLAIIVYVPLTYYFSLVGVIVGSLVVNLANVIFLYLEVIKVRASLRRKNNYEEKN